MSADDFHKKEELSYPLPDYRAILNKLQHGEDLTELERFIYHWIDPDAPHTWLQELSATICECLTKQAEISTELVLAHEDIRRSVTMLANEMEGLSKDIQNIMKGVKK